MRAKVAVAGFRTKELLITTTLLDPLKWPVETLVALYVRRWRVELYFDDIKTTMHAASMRCQSPAMVRRELLMHAIAYNLIRKIMLKSALQEGVALDQLSFKGTLDTVRHWQHNTAAQSTASGREATREAMLDLCACDLLPQRPGRCEPRVLKRRPKPYQSMTRPRKEMRVSPSRNNRGRPKKSKPRASKNAA